MCLQQVGDLVYTVVESCHVHLLFALQECVGSISLHVGVYLLPPTKLFHYFIEITR